MRWWVLLTLVSCRTTGSGGPLGFWPWGGGDDTADTSVPVDTADTAPVDTGEPCVEFSEVVAACEETVELVENGAGSYYDGIDGDSPTLLADLTELIDDHTPVSSNGIWDFFPLTDARDDGTVLDVYSDVPGGTPAYTYAFQADQCGNYQQEGDCYNREHTWPASWYGS
ncbi:MAG: endonuclease, partial [Myxococcota bacterium]|nr:endonuclease [Myxococcota bacterium]